MSKALQEQGLRIAAARHTITDPLAPRSQVTEACAVLVQIGDELDMAEVVKVMRRPDDYHEIAGSQARRRGEEDADWLSRKAREAAMKPAERDMLKPAFQDPINDPRGD